MRILSILLVLTIVVGTAFQDVQAAPLSKRMKSSFEYSASRYGIPEVLVYGVLEDDADAMIAASREYLLKKAIPEDRRTGKYDTKALNFAVVFLERASELNRLEATRILLELFSEGIGARLTSKRAEKQLNILSQSNNSEDMVMVADILSKTNKGSQAAVYYEKALFAGEPLGLARLSEYYRYGIGLTQSKAKAHACAVFHSKYGLTIDERRSSDITAQVLATSMSEHDLQESIDFQQKIYSIICNSQPISPSALAMFCAAGNITEVERVLRSGVDVNSHHAIKIPTYIIVASCNDRGNIVELLLKYGANPNVTDKDGNTPLIWMIRYADKKSVQTLIDYGANIDIADNNKRTALHWAASSDISDIIKILLNKKCNIDAQDIDKNTPLILAVKNGNSEIVEILLSKNADTSKSDNKNLTALAWGINHPQIGPMLLKRGVNRADIANKEWGPAASAAYMGNIEALEVLFENGISPNKIYSPSKYTVYPALYFAIDRKKYDAAEKIIKYIEKDFKINKNEKGILTNFILFSTMKKNKALEMLLEIEESYEIIEKNQFSLLYYAVLGNNISALNMYFKLGIDINTRDKMYDDTLLIRSIYYSKFETVEYLVKNGADVNAVNIWGNSPLLQTFISQKNEKEIEKIVKILIEAGAKIDHTNKIGINTLEEAKKYPEIYYYMREKNK